MMIPPEEYVCTYAVCWRDRLSTENCHNKQKMTMQHAIDQGDLNTKARIKVTVQNAGAQYKLRHTNEYGQI